MAFRICSLTSSIYRRGRRDTKRDARRRSDRRRSTSTPLPLEFGAELVQLGRREGRRIELEECHRVGIVSRVRFQPKTVAGALLARRSGDVLVEPQPVLVLVEGEWD